MTEIEREADAVWTGNLVDGSGVITQVTSGALEQLPITWAARTQQPNGRTSPEELLAAAQASCYAMALSNTLAKAGTEPEQLDVTAVCGADRSTGALVIRTMDITVRGRVPGLDQSGFETAAKQAEQGCPVANALRNNLAIVVHATLVGA
jgi:osmotically inducible protein OsmC